MNLEKIVIWYFLGMCIFCMGLCIYTVNVNSDLKKEAINLRSALETNPDYLFSINNTNGTAGRYFLASQNIALYTKSNSPYVVGINAHHEIGHYIWYEFLSDNLRSNYEQIYLNSDEFISEYASTSLEEDFAETVSQAIVVDIDYDKIPEDRREFVKKYAEWYIVT